jgi:hypothetical protein
MLYYNKESFCNYISTSSGKSLIESAHAYQKGLMPGYSSENLSIQPKQPTYDIGVVVIESLKLHICTKSYNNKTREAFARLSRTENPHEGNNEGENKKE